MLLKIARLLPLISLMLLGTCSKPVALTSGPAGQNFQVDGSRTEWTGRFSVPKDQPFAVAVSHSKNYVYLAMTSFDSDFRRQINMAGFTLWLDPEGKKTEVIGIKYVGRRMDFRKRGSQMDNRRGMGRDLTPDDFNRGTRAEGNHPLHGDLDLILVDINKRERLGPADLLASADSNEEGLFIEFQIPLALLGQEYLAGSNIGIGLYSEREALSPRRDQMAGSMEGGSGQRGGGMSGMGAQRQGGRPMSGPSAVADTDVKVWFNVNLDQGQN